MSLAICSRCLSRLHLSPPPPSVLATIPSSTSSFHTSTSNYATPGGKKPGGYATMKIAYRITSTPSYTGKRKKRTVPKLPAPGERRAARQRIVLSNTNALEIPDMDNLGVGNMGDEAKVGSVLGLDGGLLDQLRDAKAFKRTQNWALFRRPATLMRAETVEMGQTFERVGSEGKKEVVRQVICGDQMCGKSVLLLQALSMAYLNKWVVINVPEAVEHINNHHPYAPLAASHANGPDRQYIQPTLTADLLSRLAYSNESIFTQLTPNIPSPSSIFTSTPSNLYQIALFGADNPAHSHAVFEYVMRELTTSGRPPLLLAIDGLDHWMVPSEYRSSDHTILHAHQFTLVQFFLKHLFSNTSLPNGGVVLGATTASNAPSSPAFSLLLKQLAALNTGIEPTSPHFPLPPPYQKLDPRVTSLVSTSNSPAAGPGSTTQIKSLSSLSRFETKGLLSYFSASGLLKDPISDTTVGEKWTMAGSGNVGELCKVGARARVDPAKVLGSIGTHVGIRRGQGEHVPRG